MDSNPFSLAGKYILVTGASSGIGRAIAIACSNMGGGVIINGRDSQRLAETASAAKDGSMNYIAADLTRQEDIEMLAARLPKLDGIVHCAGVGNRVFCKNITTQDIERVFDPNIKAPMLLQKAILEHKKINKGASVVFIASRAAEAPSMGNAIYSASKGAIISYAKCLALELAARAIRVNCVCPAMVWTDLILQDGITKADLEESESKYPLKRYGQPEDIAHLCVYLLSDASSWMTGSCIDITGGGEGTLI